MVTPSITGKSPQVSLQQSPCLIPVWHINRNAFLICSYLKENNIEVDGEISEEVIGFGEILPKGEYVLVNDILNKEEEELSAKKGDEVVAYDDEAPIDTVLGVEIFPVVHVKTQEKIYVSLEDIKDEN